MGESAGSPDSLLPTHLPRPSSKQFGTLLGGLGGEEGQNRSRMTVVTGGVRWHRGHSPHDTLVSSSRSHLTAAPEAGDATSGCLLTSPPSQHLCAQWHPPNPLLRSLHPCQAVLPLYFLFLFQHLYWSIIALQWCVSFCCITK